MVRLVKVQGTEIELKFCKQAYYFFNTNIENISTVVNIVVIENVRLSRPNLRTCPEK